MDPLDQRLTDAGLAWRRTQPEPPDLDRMVVALRRHRSGLFQGRLMYTFLAGLLLVAALAVAPGVGSFLQGNHSPAPTIPTTPPSATPAPTAPSPSVSTKPEPSAPAVPSDSDRAVELVHQYEDALVSAKWQVAFDLLGTTSLTHDAGFATFKDERAAYFDSVKGRYTVGDPARVTDWTDYAPLVQGADRTRAWLIEVDYPALAGNNAGYEQFVVAPDAGGTWRIWPVR
jgi:hypothetical protein